MACRVNAISKLKSSEHRNDCVLLLSTLWAPNSESSHKRSRFETDTNEQGAPAIDSDFVHSDHGDLGVFSTIFGCDGMPESDFDSS